MSVQIIIDSTVDVSEKLKDRFLVVPLTVTFGEEEFLDGVTISRRQFYEKLIEGDTLPVTSQAPPAAFEEVYKKVCAAGDTAVVLTIASQLSGTYQSAVIASEDYEGKVFVIDTQSAALASGILAERALQLKEEGMDAKTIAETLEQEKDKACILAMLDTLEYLKRGGRISKAAAVAGGILSIKPVITVKNGEIQVLGKARGSKQGNNMLVSEIDKAGGVDFEKPVLLGYSGLSDLLLKKYIEDSRHLWDGNCEELHCTMIDSAIGTHVGPGAIAVAFFKK